MTTDTTTTTNEILDMLSEYHPSQKDQKREILSKIDYLIEEGEECLDYEDYETASEHLYYALRVCDDSLEKTPDEYEYHLRQAMIMQCMKDAGDDFEDEDITEAVNKAIALIDKELTKKPDNYLFIEKIKTLQEYNRFDEALTAIDVALKTDVLDYYLVDTYNQQEKILTQLDRHTEALTAINKAIELKPDSHDIYFNYYHKTLTLIKLDRYEEALLSIKQAIKARNDWDLLYKKLVDVLIKLEKYDEALLIIEKAQQKFLPDDCRAFIYQKKQIEEILETNNQIKSIKS